MDTVCMIRFYMILTYKTKFNSPFVIILNYTHSYDLPRARVCYEGLLVELSLYLQKTFSGGLAAGIAGDDVTRRSRWQQGE